VLQLDDGKKVTLNEGDVVCQRGTSHCWRNESSEWSRIYFVLLGEFFRAACLRLLTWLCPLGAKPVVINGKELKEQWGLPPSN